MIGPVLRVVLSYAATLAFCSTIYIGLVAVRESDFGVISILGAFVLVFVFALLFTIIPFIIARGVLAYFRRCDWVAFALAGLSVGLVVGQLLWRAYGFTYVGETGWGRMAVWLAVSGLLGGVAGLVQLRVERALGKGIPPSMPT